MSYKIAGHDVDVRTTIDEDGKLRSKLDFDGERQGIAIGLSKEKLDRVIEETGVDGLIDLIIDGHLASLEWHLSVQDA